jgi:predicted hydrolase (HD superfamily)
MSRDEAHQLLTKYLTNKNLIKHSLAAEACMKALYKHLTPTDQQTSEDETKWGIVGLLHDMDYEEAQKAGQVDKHGTLSFIQEKDDLPADILHAVQAHAYEYSQVMPENNMDWSIRSCDQITGLITAGALVLPDKKLASLTAESVLKRFKEKSFARGANRESILLCEEKLNIPLEKFVEINLSAMQSISSDLGL